MSANIYIGDYGVLGLISRNGIHISKVYKKITRIYIELQKTTNSQDNPSCEITAGILQYPISNFTKDLVVKTAWY